MSFNLNLNNIAGNILKGHSIQSSVLRGLASSGLSGIARKLTTSLMGGMTKSYFYMTNIDSGGTICFSWTPEKVSASGSSRFQSYDVIEKGEVKIPKGVNLRTVKWSGKLPGESRLDYNFISSSDWKDPKTIIQMIEQWKEKGDKIRLLITQTSVNTDVFIQDFSYEWTGGHGDADYSIELIDAKDMIVKTVQEVDAEKAAAAATSAVESPSLNSRPDFGILGSITATESTSIWSAAEKALGDGGKWSSIYSLNSSKLKNPESLVAGMKLKLPQ